MGGYYDAGDNVKFGLPMAFTITMMSWSIVEYGKQMAANGELAHAMEAVKWGTDYLIKAHPQPDVLYGEVCALPHFIFLLSTCICTSSTSFVDRLQYCPFLIKTPATHYLHIQKECCWVFLYILQFCLILRFFFCFCQVGDGNTDHYCWQRPEDMTTDRRAYKIDPSNPGSDLAGETAAAMAAASIVFHRSNPSYATELLSHAQQVHLSPSLSLPQKKKPLHRTPPLCLCVQRMLAQSTVRGVVAPSSLDYVALEMAHVRKTVWLKRQLHSVAFLSGVG